MTSGHWYNIYNPVISVQFTKLADRVVGNNDKIIKERTSASTSLIKVQVSSREDVGVTYECSFSPEKWSYTIMDKISEELADQLTMKQNLNRGLLMKLSCYEE